MRHYEIVVLVHPGQSEQVPAMLERYEALITGQKGRVHRVEDWGRRRLAYSINDLHKAHYIMLNVECDLTVLRELEKSFKFSDSVLRSLVIRRAAAITEESAMAKAKSEEDRQEAERELAQQKLAEAKQAEAETAEEAAAPSEAPETTATPPKESAPAAAEDSPAKPKSAAAKPSKPKPAKKPMQPKTPEGASQEEVE